MAQNSQPLGITAQTWGEFNNAFFFSVIQGAGVIQELVTMTKKNKACTTFVLLIYQETNFNMYAIQNFFQIIASMQFLWLLGNKRLQGK